MASAPGFPQMMVHPQHRAAVLADFSSGDGLPGAPERYPPIEVHDENQEAATRARGYLRYGEQMPKLAEYNEFPKVMSHPEHVDPVAPTKGARPDGNGGMVIFDIPGTPERMPNVTVRNEDEEAEWQAKGYAAAGHSDGYAFERAHVSAGDPGSEWPKWVDGVLMQDPDAPVDLTKDYPKWLHFEEGASVLVNDPSHEARVLLSRGSEKHEPIKQPEAPKPYVPLVPTPRSDDPDYVEFLAWKEARAKAHADPAPDPAEDEDRATLIALAEETGIKVDKRWRLSRLREAVLGADAAE